MPSPNFTERKNPAIRDSDYVKSVSICLNPQDNGGESVTLEVDFFHNGDPKNSIYTNIHIQSGCYGVHSNRQSFFGVSIEAFSESFRHMTEVAYLLEKEGRPDTKKPETVSSMQGLHTKESHKLEKIKELIENAEDYDVLYDIATIVGADVET